MEQKNRWQHWCWKHAGRMMNNNNSAMSSPTTTKPAAATTTNKNEAKSGQTSDNHDPHHHHDNNKKKNKTKRSRNKSPCVEDCDTVVRGNVLVTLPDGFELDRKTDANQTKRLSVDVALNQAQLRLQYEPCELPATVDRDALPMHCAADQKQPQPQPQPPSADSALSPRSMACIATVFKQRLVGPLPFVVTIPVRPKTSSNRERDDKRKMKHISVVGAVQVHHVVGYTSHRREDSDAVAASNDFVLGCQIALADRDVRKEDKDSKYDHALDVRILLKQRGDLAAPVHSSQAQNKNKKKDKAEDKKSFSYDRFVHRRFASPAEAQQTAASPVVAVAAAKHKSSSESGRWQTVTCSSSSSSPCLSSSPSCSPDSSSSSPSSCSASASRASCSSSTSPSLSPSPSSSSSSSASSSAAACSLPLPPSASAPFASPSKKDVLRLAGTVRSIASTAQRVHDAVWVRVELVLLLGGMQQEDKDKDNGKKPEKPASVVASTAVHLVPGGPEACYELQARLPCISRSSSTTTNRHALLLRFVCANCRVTGPICSAASSPQRAPRQLSLVVNDGCWTVPSDESASCSSSSSSAASSSSCSSEEGDDNNKERDGSTDVIDLGHTLLQDVSAACADCCDKEDRGQCSDNDNDDDQQEHSSEDSSEDDEKDSDTKHGNNNKQPLKKKSKKSKHAVTSLLGLDWKCSNSTSSPLTATLSNPGLGLLYGPVRITSPGGAFLFHDIRPCVFYTLTIRCALTGATVFELVGVVQVDRGCNQIRGTGVALDCGCSVALSGTLACNSEGPGAMVRVEVVLAAQPDVLVGSTTVEVASFPTVVPWTVNVPAGPVSPGTQYTVNFYCDSNDVPLGGLTLPAGTRNYPLFAFGCELCHLPPNTADLEVTIEANASSGCDTTTIPGGLVTTVQLTGTETSTQDVTFGGGHPTTATLIYEGLTAPGTYTVTVTCADNTAIVLGTLGPLTLAPGNSVSDTITLSNCSSC